MALASQMSSRDMTDMDFKNPGVLSRVLGEETNKIGLFSHWIATAELLGLYSHRTKEM